MMPHRRFPQARRRLMLPNSSRTPRQLLQICLKINPLRINQLTSIKAQTKPTSTSAQSPPVVQSIQLTQIIHSHEMYHHQDDFSNYQCLMRKISEIEFSIPSRSPTHLLQQIITSKHLERPVKHWSQKCSSPVRTLHRPTTYGAARLRLLIRTPLPI